MLLPIPIFSTGSSDSLMPAVSINLNSIPPMTAHSSTVSLVVPANSDTIALSSPKSALSKVLFPLFGSPTIAIGTPLLIALPTLNDPARASHFAAAPSSSPRSLSLSANSTSSSLKSSSNSTSAESSTSCSRTFPNSAEYPPFSWFIAILCCASVCEAITSATASACARSIFPDRNALRENSPASASLHPALQSASRMCWTMYAEAWQ